MVPPASHVPSLTGLPIELHLHVGRMLRLGTDHDHEVKWALNALSQVSTGFNHRYDPMLYDFDASQLLSSAMLYGADAGDRGGRWTSSRRRLGRTTISAATPLCFPLGVRSLSPARRNVRTGQGDGDGDSGTLTPSRSSSPERDSQTRNPPRTTWIPGSRCPGAGPAFANPRHGADHHPRQGGMRLAYPRPPRPSWSRLGEDVLFPGRRKPKHDAFIYSAFGPGVRLQLGRLEHTRGVGGPICLTSTASRLRSWCICLGSFEGDETLPHRLLRQGIDPSLRTHVISHLHMERLLQDRGVSRLSSLS